MKKSELRKIIKEEIRRLNEGNFPDRKNEDYYWDGKFELRDYNSDVVEYVIKNYKKIIGKEFDYDREDVPNSEIKKIEKFLKKNGLSKDEIENSRNGFWIVYADYFM